MLKKTTTTKTQNDEWKSWRRLIIHNLRKKEEIKHMSTNTPAYDTVSKNQWDQKQPYDHKQVEIHKNEQEIKQKVTNQ